MSANEQAIRHLYHVAEAAHEDLDAFIACFAADGAFIDMASGLGFRGHAELRQPVAALSRAFPDMHRQLEQLHVTGDVVVVELRLQGTHRGPLTWPGGTIEATGRVMDLPCCDVFQLADGKVKTFRCYNQLPAFVATLVT